MENVKKEKNKKMITIGLIVFIVLLLVSAGTYAYWTWVTAENERTNVTLSIEAPDMSARLTGYTQNITNLIPISSCTDPQYAIKKELTLTYENLSTNTGAILGTLKIENFTSPYGTPDANDLSHLHYAVTKSPDNCTAEPLEGMSGTFTETSGNLFTSQLLAGPIPTGTESGSQTYYLWVWLDSEYTHQNVGSEVTNDPMQNISFTLVWEGEIKNDAYEYTGADGNFKYLVLDSGKIQITRYLGSATELVIPATYDGYQVYSVGNPAAGLTAATRYNIVGATNQTSNSTITSLTISEGIEVIEMAAFSKMNALTGTLTLPSTLKKIGHTAFNNCKGLTGDLVIPNSVTEIDTAAFQSCSGFNGTLTLSNSLKRIGNNAFFKCTGFTGNLIIPEGVTTLERSAFNTCSGFNGTLTLPSTLSTIGEYAFTDSTGLTGDLVIPEGVVKIEESAFQSLTGMTGSLTLPNTLEEIGPFAFAYTKNLTGGVTIPNSVTIIEEGAFNGCSGFNGILTLSNKLKEMGDYAFNHCSGFTNTTLDIPATLKKIGSIENDATHVFYDFATKTIEEYTVNNSNNGSGTKFKVVDGILYTADGTRMSAYPASKVGNSYVMPEGVTTIDELAFSRAGSTYSSVPDTGIKKLVLPNSFQLTTTLPSNYINVGNNLAVGIYNQTGINEIEVKSDNSNYKTIDGVLYSKDGTVLWYVPFAKTGSISLPEGLTTIKSGALYASKARSITSLTIPASVTTIDSTELTELKALGTSKVTFDENCVYQFDASGNVVKSS